MTLTAPAHLRGRTISPHKSSKKSEEPNRMTTHHQPDGGPATMTPAELLALHDKFMSGAGVTEAEKVMVNSIALAAAFGSAAFIAGMDDDQGTHAMLRAFLLALVDPMHPDLDYLRRDPAAAKAAREGGAS